MHDHEAWVGNGWSIIPNVCVCVHVYKYIYILCMCAYITQVITQYNAKYLLALRILLLSLAFERMRHLAAAGTFSTR